MLNPCACCRNDNTGLDRRYRLKIKESSGKNKADKSNYMLSGSRAFI